MQRPPKLVPPVYFALTIAAMAALHFWLPLAHLIRSPFTRLGFALIALGLSSIAWSWRLFSRLGTPVIPFERSTVLVTLGPYRITRNPMYLGMLCTLLGIAVFAGSLGAFLPIPLFVWVIQKRFIEGEERFLEGIFGARYLSYKKSVRRWI